jgi:hypothetical protein
LGFGLTSSFAVSFEVVFFCLFYHNSFNILRKNILITAACFAAVAIGVGWVLSVERCQTQTPSFQSLWQFHFQEGI